MTVNGEGNIKARLVPIGELFYDCSEFQGTLNHFNICLFAPMYETFIDSEFDTNKAVAVPVLYILVTKNEY